MSKEVPVALHPVAIIEDRYQGVYSGGQWWAVAQADRRIDSTDCVRWLFEHGPGSGDVDAAIFWAHRPPWIAVGNTPHEALARLLESPGADTDEWTPPPIEADPRYRSYYGCDE